eukprot:PhM_4_TR8760/c0_g1_i1/m.37034
MRGKYLQKNSSFLFLFTFLRIFILIHARVTSSLYIPNKHIVIKPLPELNSLLLFLFGTASKFKRKVLPQSTGLCRQTGVGLGLLARSVLLHDLNALGAERAEGKLV